MRGAACCERVGVVGRAGWLGPDRTPALGALWSDLPLDGDDCRADHDSGQAGVRHDRPPAVFGAAGIGGIRAGLCARTDHRHGRGPLRASPRVRLGPWRRGRCLARPVLLRRVGSDVGASHIRLGRRVWHRSGLPHGGKPGPAGGPGTARGPRADGGVERCGVAGGLHRRSSDVRFRLRNRSGPPVSCWPPGPRQPRSACSCWCRRATCNGLRLAAGAGVRSALAHALEGLRYVRRNRVLLGAISLDLFAVLLGGANGAVCPPSPRSASAWAPWVSVGWRLRSGIGASAVMVTLSVRPLQRRVGPSLMAAVATFGVGTIALGLTRSYIVAFVALLVLGGADAVSIWSSAARSCPLATPEEDAGTCHGRGVRVHRGIE